MKKLLITLLSAVLFFCIHILPASALTIEASASILIDLNSGKVLFQENSTQALPPASTTKILTALVALENGTLDQEITIPANFVNVGEVGVWLKAGETHTLEDLLYALLLRSANDAAQAIAIGIAGSETAFVSMMNQRSQELGLTSSTWKNVHGLYEDGHLTSAADLAIIARIAMQNEAFRTIVATKEYQIPWPGNDSPRDLYNRNQFLTTYEGATGIKTGQTTQSGSCLIASSARGNMSLIGVVLNSDEMYKQMAVLMDYGYEAFEMRQIGKAGDVLGQVKVNSGWENEVEAMLSKNIYMIMPKDKETEPVNSINLNESVDAPFVKGQPIGSIRYTDGEGGVVEAELVARNDVVRFTFWGTIKGVFSRIFGFLLH